MSEAADRLSPDRGQALPVQGRLFGIDYGTKRVGVAVSDVLQKIAGPLHNYTRVSRRADECFFYELAQEYEVAGLVVGLPVHMSGDESEKSREARKYAAWLARVTRLPVAFQDERYSSSRAEALLIQAHMTSRQRSTRIDKLAAQILLQDFLDARSAEADVS
ncbi:MAG: Holliday junction resolvase RuvX [Planctomycetaceae bacterium]